MAVVGPQNVGLPGYRPGDQQKKPTRVVVGPQNVGLPGYRPGDAGNPYPPAPAPVAAPPPAAPAAAPAAPPAPPPIDYDSVINDPSYLRGSANLDAQNTIDVANINRDFAMRGQQTQDAANAHGGLFGGAAANSMNNLVGLGGAQDRALFQQGVHNKTSHDDLHQRVWERLTAPGGLIGGTA